jgi:Ser/Thr protein kinase RdoA (MazF antagonist)
VHDPVASAAQITPEWLTETLRRNGSLTRGRATGVVVQATHTHPVSVVSHLAVTYAPGTSRDAPTQLFLKVSNPDFEPAAPRERPPEEIEFYHDVAPRMPAAPLPRCYDAAFSRTTGRAHLLLEDLSATHYHPPRPLADMLAECELATDCLAQVHAFWWEHAELGRGVGRLLSAAEVDELASRAAANFTRFVTAHGARLSTDERRLFAQVIATFPRPWVRLTSAKGLTVTHGDAHQWNFLFPRQPNNGRVYLIDWQLWHVHIGPRDLAYMLILWCAPERRAQMEQTLLRRYHQALLAGGVRGYSWDDCWKDYRWSAVRTIFIPLWHWAKGRPETLWGPQLDRSLRAFAELRCSELLES